MPSVTDFVREIHKTPRKHKSTTKNKTKGDGIDQRPTETSLPRCRTDKPAYI